VSYDARDDSDPEKKLGEMNRHDRKWRETTGKGHTKADGREGLGQLRIASFRDWRARPSILTHA